MNTTPTINKYYAILNTYKISSFLHECVKAGQYIRKYDQTILIKEACSNLNIKGGCTNNLISQYFNFLSKKGIVDDILTKELVAEFVTYANKGREKPQTEDSVDPDLLYNVDDKSYYLGYIEGLNEAKRIIEKTISEFQEFLKEMQ